MQMIFDEATLSHNQMRRRFRNIHAYKREQRRWDWLVRATPITDVDYKPDLPLPAPIRLIVTRCNHRLLDWDNMGAGLKFTLDALVHNGIIKDDSPSIIASLELRQRKVKGIDAKTIFEFVIDEEPEHY